MAATRLSSRAIAAMSSPVVQRAESVYGSITVVMPRARAASKTGTTSWSTSDA